MIWLHDRSMQNRRLGKKVRKSAILPLPTLAMAPSGKNLHQDLEGGVLAPSGSVRNAPHLGHAAHGLAELLERRLDRVEAALQHRARVQVERAEAGLLLAKLLLQRLALRKIECTASPSLPCVPTPLPCAPCSCMSGKAFAATPHRTQQAVRQVSLPQGRAQESAPGW